MNLEHFQGSHLVHVYRTSKEKKGEGGGTEQAIHSYCSLPVRKGLNTAICGPISPPPIRLVLQHAQASMQLVH